MRRLHVRGEVPDAMHPLLHVAPLAARAHGEPTARAHRLDHAIRGAAVDPHVPRARLDLVGPLRGVLADLGIARRGRRKPPSREPVGPRCRRSAASLRGRSASAPAPRTGDPSAHARRRSRRAPRPGQERPMQRRPRHAEGAGDVSDPRAPVPERLRMPQHLRRKVTVGRMADPHPRGTCALLAAADLLAVRGVARTRAGAAHDEPRELEDRLGGSGGSGVSATRTRTERTRLARGRAHARAYAGRRARERSAWASRWMAATFAANACGVSSRRPPRWDSHHRRCSSRSAAARAMRSRIEITGGPLARGAAPQARARSARRSSIGPRT